MPQDKNCTKCTLRDNTLSICTWGEGPIPCEIMLVGMALGPTENKYGKVFIGPAGHKLDDGLHFFKLDRHNLYITNVIRCLGPPINDIKAAHKKACLPYLLEEIDQVQPKLIVALGADALQVLTGKKEVYKNIGRLFPFKYDSSISVAGALHPAALLHGKKRDGADNTKAFLRGLLTIRRWIDKDIVDKSDYGTYIINPSDKQIFQYLSRVRETKEMTLDIETNKLRIYDNDFIVRAIGITVQEREAIVIPWTTVSLPVREELKQILLDPTIKINGHNIKFDQHGLEKEFNIDIKNPVNADTILLHYLLYDYKPHNLTSLSWEYTKMGGYDNEVVKEGGAHKIPLGDDLYNYCGGDVDITHRLRNILLPKVMEDDLLRSVYSNLLLPASSTFRKMERMGVIGDREKFEELYTEIGKERALILEDLKQIDSIKELMDRKHLVEFNPRSPVQCVDLVQKLEINIFKKTDKGNPSVDSEVLDFYAPDYPELKMIKDWRTLASIQTHIKNEDDPDKDTFIASISDDGRIHTSLNLFIARSGRSSSSGPNLQNLPVRLTEEYPQFNIRNAFIADPDYTFLSADYSLHELRVLAAVSHDRHMIEVLKSGKDPHSDMGSVIANISYDEFIKRYNEGDETIKGFRRDGKDVMFGTVYGIGPVRLGYKTRKGEVEGKRLLALHEQLHPDYYEWKAKIEDFIKREKYAPLITGRRRSFQSVGKNELRAGINACIQGPASDILLMGLIVLDKFFTERKMKSFPVLAIHDEVIILAHKDEMEELPEMIEPLLLRPPGFNLDWLGEVELKVDFAKGYKLGELEDI